MLKVKIMMADKKQKRRSKGRRNFVTFWIIVVISNRQSFSLSNRALASSDLGLVLSRAEPFFLSMESSLRDLNYTILKANIVTAALATRFPYRV